MGAPRKPWVDGTPCKNCRKPLKSDERYKQTSRLCRTCGNANRQAQNHKRRAKSPMPCRACGKPMTDGREKRFGRCAACKAANAGNCACGQPVHIGQRCIDCYRIEHADAQSRRRNRPARLCKCGARIGDNATKCRRCNMAAVGTATTERRAVALEAVARLVAQAWPGLRGPGGEWEKGPTNVQGWATLDGGRL